VYIIKIVNYKNLDRFLENFVLR